MLCFHMFSLFFLTPVLIVVLAMLHTQETPMSPGTWAFAGSIGPPGDLGRLKYGEPSQRDSAWPYCARDLPLFGQEDTNAFQLSCTAQHCAVLDCRPTGPLPSQ